ncbi:MAG: aldehyde dehydrogenase family protein [Armatimonadota bacterium]|nr:aldehyde dehydrogenase family protein [Armatimonadota bacterium]MDR7428231.1 aldehyde dehydrogenase family protein [Armatimonadota bacterium]MDR7464351.1 aldehyde dehydrogenase family protein [Armatimonadota bacterium]MDR7470102.1 aldehyde dehydrogenase family protein [Armatimonadota bacterium]MDR7474960.1 aldehyde dehydrogenase family protein [Armatimonadota bacterium]
MAELFRMIIDGRAADARSGETVEVRNPANVDEVVGIVPKGDREDVRAAIDAAVAALGDSWWPRIYESRRRGKVLQRFAALVEEHKDRLARLLTREQGKIYRESVGELDSLINTFDYYAGYAGKIAGEVKYLRDNDSIIKVETRKQPIGLCAAILPFNFPVSLYAWKVAPALIAGNAVLIKPASTTPLTDIALTALLQEAGVPPGIASIVTGPASTVGDEILRHPAVKRIAFTGSTEVGRLVAQAASPALKHITLELGGSDPTVVADDADLELATDTIVRFGRFRNAGQSCTSVKRVYVFAAVFERFVDLLAAKTAALRVGDGLDPATDMGPLNNAQQREDVERFVADALARRATVVVGGRRLTEGPYARGYFFQPTVIADLPEDAALWREECFGPVLPVMPVRDLEEALQRANSTSYGLGAGLWSRSDRTIERFIEGIESGIVWINYKPLSVPETPFGGVKDSGHGRELGAEGLAEYLETKSIRKYVGKA